MKSEPGIGAVIAGYRIDGLLGRGGMGVVYLAEDVTLGRKAVVKLLAPELTENENFRKRFVRESHLAAAIDHPNILPIYQAGEFNGLLYIAMRFVEGDDLRGLLLREGSLDLERSLSIITQVARALNAAHARGLVHRDVKPGNILITVGPEEAEHVYLTDFGLTKQTSSDSGLTGTGTFVGTIDYVSPEQIQGLPLDGRADIYALGCVFFECLTGQVPFRKEGEVAVMFAHLSEPPPSLLDFREDLPAGLDVVIARAMAKSREDRYPTALAMAAQALMQAQSGVEVTPENEKAPPLQAPPSQAVTGSDVVDLTLINSASEVERRKEQEAKSRTGEQAGQEGAVQEEAEPAGEGAEEVTRIASRSEFPSSQQSVALGAPGSAPGGARAAETTDSMQAPQPGSGMAESPTLAPPAEPASQVQPSPTKREGKRKRSRSLVIAVVGALVLAGGVGVFLVLPKGSPNPPPSASPSTPSSTPSSTLPPSPSPVIRLAPASFTGPGITGGVRINALISLSSGLVAVGSDSSAGTDSVAAVWTSADEGRSWTRTPSTDCSCSELGAALQMNDVAEPLDVSSSGPVAVGTVTYSDGRTGAAVWTQDRSTGSWARVPKENCDQCDQPGDDLQMSSVAAVGPSLVAVGGSTVIVQGKRKSAAAVWRSTDGGRSWSRIQRGAELFSGASLKMTSVTAVRLDKVVAVGFGDRGAAVWDSNDGGSTWSRVLTKLCDGCRNKGRNMLGVTAIGHILVAVGTDESAGVSQSGGTTDAIGAIWASTDGGSNWTRVPKTTPSLLGTSVQIRAVIPAVDGFLAVGNDGNGAVVWKSPGDAATWTRVPKSRCVNCSGSVAMNDLVAVGTGFVVAGFATESSKDSVAAWVGSNGASPTS